MSSWKLASPSASLCVWRPVRVPTHEACPQGGPGRAGRTPSEPRVRQEKSESLAADTRADLLGPALRSTDWLGSGHVANPKPIAEAECSDWRSLGSL